MRAEMRRTARANDAAALAESEARHRVLLASLPEGVVLQDADGVVLTANPAACHLLGVGPAELAGRSAVPRVPAADQGSGSASGPVPSSGPGPAPASGSLPAPRRGGRERVPVADVMAQALGPALTALRTGRTQDRVPVTLDHAGGPSRLTVTAVPLLGDDGQPRAVVSSLAAEVTTPGTDRGAGRGEEMFRLAMRYSPIGFGLTALNGRFLRVNRKLCRMLGYRADELTAKTLYDILHPDDLGDTSLRIGELLRGDLDSVELERRYLGHGGMVLWGTLAVTLLRDDAGRGVQLIVQISDVSEIRKAHELLTHMTLHDPLTGLPNRTLVLDRIGKALDRGHRHNRRVAVLMLDLDHFKVVNDSVGHERGDEVLVEVSRRITRALRASDTAGRLGGDEFVVVCEDVADEREAIVVAERVQNSIGVPITVGRRTLVPTASIGIAVSSSSAVDPLTLLRDADIATFRAKDTGRNRWDVVDVALRRRAMERLDIEHALRTALDVGELRLHFQPIVDVGSLHVVGREALLRWHHPERGLLAPGEFLHVAEESGLIVDIGRWVLGEATGLAAGAPETDGYVAINVSPHQVARPGLVGTVEKALSESGLRADRLVLELTESVMLSAAPAARREIELLDDLGVRIVVDDFGTGFSALSYLRDLPVSGIKVDRSFTAGLGRDGHSERIVEALTGLGRGLGVDVVVEGVETEQQHGVLAALGAEHAQGYLFGRPGPDYLAEPPVPV